MNRNTRPSRSRIARRVRLLRWELRHWIVVRRVVLRAGLAVRGVPHAAGGDAVVVFVPEAGLWFDIYAWQRTESGLTWIVDHPHHGLDDESWTGLEIACRTGWTFPLHELPDIWRHYHGADDPVAADH